MISNSDKKTEKSLCTNLAALKSQSRPLLACRNNVYLNPNLILNEISFLLFVQLKADMIDKYE